jgi:hypothetical protein
MSELSSSKRPRVEGATEGAASFSWGCLTQAPSYANQGQGQGQEQEQSERLLLVEASSYKLDYTPTNDNNNNIEENGQGQEEEEQEQEQPEQKSWCDKHMIPEPTFPHIELSETQILSEVILVGDIHGCLDEFKALLALCDYQPNKHTLILLGDLVNKGPKSAEVVKYARELGCLCVRGNHGRF